MCRDDSELLVWHSSQVIAADRQHLLGPPVTIWLTGLSAAGKSTIAYALERMLIDQGRLCFVLDGDNVRHGLNNNVGFSPEDRCENIRRVAEVAKLMNAAGLIVIAAFISPYAQDRRQDRDIIGVQRFREVYVSTSLAVCEARDPKGMYGKARTGYLPGFTGVDAAYEVPEHPDLQLDTEVLALDACLTLMLQTVFKEASA